MEVTMSHVDCYILNPSPYFIGAKKIVTYNLYITPPQQFIVSYIFSPHQNPSLGCLA